MKLIELVIDETNEDFGVTAMSVVDLPAIEEDFIFFSKQPQIFKEVDKEKRILMGAAMIPDKKIYRKEKDEEFEVFFSKDTVVKASQLFLKNNNQSEATLQHESDVNNLTVVESWIIEDEVQDKSRKFGLDLPVGTWMISMKVDNDEVWNDYVKTGKVKGFSIEGYFADKMVKQSKQLSEDEILLQKIKEILTK